MPTPLRLLILEDEPLDAELTVATLEAAGYDCDWVRVSDQEAFERALREASYDLVLADYRLPAFDGISALHVFKERGLNIPFVIVSGTLGEELATESLKAGATDYVLKQRLDRLGPVVERALREKEEQRRRRLAEEELRKLSQAIKQSPVSIMITSLDGTIEYVNPRFSETTGYTAAEVIGANPRILKGGRTTPEEYAQLWQTISAGQEWRGEFYNRRKDGSFFWETASISAIKDADGRITHYLAVKEDITERKRIEDQAREQERLATVGQLAAGIAHDFNNILAVIALYSDLLSSKETSADGQKKLQIISQQSKRATELIQQILDFSRRASLARAPLELKYQLQELVKLWKRTLPDNITVQFDYGADAYAVYADPTRMQQMLMNLVINARDAMPDGGTLTVGLERKLVNASRYVSPTDLPPGEWIQIAVTDTGTGIPPEVLPHIYEPFYTTKEPGSGTGLGLSQVYGIVKQHDGHLAVHTAVNRGTTFVISLPALPERDAADEVEQPTIITAGRQELILVIEDDELTRNAIIDSLDALNYQAIAATNGREGLALIMRRPDDIALILCDQAMPEMSGPDLLATLKHQQVAIPFVMMSAHSQQVDLDRLRALGMAEWLSKPLRLHDLSGILKRFVRPAAHRG